VTVRTKEGEREGEEQVTGREVAEVKGKHREGED